MDRYLLESEVVKAVDEHTDDEGKLDDDITCILEEVIDSFTAKPTNTRRIITIRAVYDISEAGTIDYGEVTPSDRVEENVKDQIEDYFMDDDNFLELSVTCEDI